ncbi:MAG TPA: hypothetical protein PLI51_04695 [bacterium]|nr:hypothetical protein [bacterium]HPQ66009.1 hypothetical protein [bacterium]
MNRNAGNVVLSAAALTALALLFGGGGCGKGGSSPGGAGAGPSPAAQMEEDQPSDYAAHGIIPHPARFWEKSE